jgi:hypothetical protein
MKKSVEPGDGVRETATASRMTRCRNVIATAPWVENTDRPNWLANHFLALRLELLSDVFFDEWQQTGRFEGLSPFRLGSSRPLASNRQRSHTELDETIETRR